MKDTLYLLVILIVTAVAMMFSRECDRLTVERDVALAKPPVLEVVTLPPVTEVDTVYITPAYSKPDMLPLANEARKLEAMLSGDALRQHFVVTEMWAKAMVR